jgi:hypothetical protein
MTMASNAKRVRAKPGKKLEVDEALIALFIGAMNANGHVAREELARAHHLIWSTRRFRRESGETVGRLIDRMKRVLEGQDAPTVIDRAAKAVPARLRQSAFAVVADLLRPPVPVSDRGTLGGLTQFLTQFGFPGSSTRP